MATDIGGAILLYDAFGLSSADAKCFFDAMEALPRLLAKSPLEVTVPIRKLGTDLLLEVQKALGTSETIEDRNSELLNWLACTYSRIPQVILACTDDHELAKLVRANNPKALWGGALGPLALVYKAGNRYLVWHEAMHLLGAKDCYDKAGRRTCRRDNCLMQYVPCEHTVEDWPFLCDANAGRVRRRVGKLRSSCG